MADADATGLWGQKTNNNLGSLLEQAICGVSSIVIPADASYTLTTANYTTVGDQARSAVLSFTSAVSLTAQRNIFLPSGVQKVYIVYNGTTGSQNLAIGVSGNTPAIISPSTRATIYCDGTNTYAVGTAVALNAVQNWTAAQTFVQTGGTKQTPTISGGALTINLALGDYFDVSLNANITTMTISNALTSNYPNGFILRFTANGTPYTVSWPGSVKWPAGTAPTLTSASTKQDMFVFTTADGGTTWNATIIGQNF